MGLRLFLGEGATARTAVSSTTRTAGAASEYGATGTSARLGAGATRTLSASRYCVRPRGTSSCTYHAASDSESAAQRHVRSPNRVGKTAEPNVFEVIDAVGNVIGILESVAATADERSNDYSASSAGNDATRTYDSEARRLDPAPETRELRQGLIMNFDTNGSSYVIWSDGPVAVSANQRAPHVMLAAGERLRFDGVAVIHAMPRSSQSTTLFSQRTESQTNRRAENQRIQPAEGEVFRYGTPTVCPQVPIGNGMARCQ